MNNHKTNLHTVSVNVIEAPEKSSLPEHLMALPGGEWALWRTVGLRGAGFPATLVDKLSAPECAAVAERLLQASEIAQISLQKALDAVKLALNELEHGDKEMQNLLVKAKRALNKGEIPQSIDFSNIGVEIEAFRSARTQVDLEWANLKEAFTTSTSQISEVIRDLAQDDRFREAIIWQNRRLLHSAIKPLLSRTSETTRNSKQRNLEQLFGMYLQRYCVKNDTIGFFGPVGWAKLVSQGTSLSVRPGANFLELRNVGFESWCIESLAEALSKNKAILPWLAPSRMPFIRIEGNTLYVPMQAPSEISAAHAALLQACNGKQTALEIAVCLQKEFASEISSKEEIYQILEHLQSIGLISWNLEIPVQPNAEQILRSTLMQIGDETLRTTTLEALEKIEIARSAIASAAGDSQRLDRAMEDLETVFTNLTGMETTRGDGQTYAGRTLVYEDCRRDLKAEIGYELIEPLSQPLSLLLTSARWLTYQTAIIYRQVFKELYSELVQKIGSPSVDASIFWQQAEPLLMDEKIRPYNQVLSMFQKRWAEVLSISEEQRRINYTSEELLLAVQEAFTAPHAGWRTARYHSPDVLIDAPNIEAIKRGDYQFVLGELHFAVNPLLNPLWYLQHPKPQELLSYYEQDFPEPFLVPVPHKQWSRLTTRNPLVVALPKDFLLLVFSDASGLPQSQVVPIGELVVEDINNELVVRSRDGKLQFDIIEAFDSILTSLVIDSFKIFAQVPHLPRITIDCLVVQRESWGFLPTSIPFAELDTEEERFVAVRRWANDHGMPRHVFVKSPIEVKPFYVDFDSPIYVDILAKTIRKSIKDNPSSLITFTEMLPAHDGFWLPDTLDQRYTSELRMVAFDLKMIEQV
jgi:Lantibiotic dehydratase, N terminus